MTKCPDTGKLQLKVHALEAEIERLKALVPQPKVESVWWNVYSDRSISSSWGSRASADGNKWPYRIAVLRIDTIKATDGTVTHRVELESI
jgi:hypothetical protein